uniref:autotransporter assembly complex protein TamA n=1 Tax=Macromonas nakdongensis TaxID=1843082 RepID=UPI000C331EBE
MNTPLRRSAGDPARRWHAAWQPVLLAVLMGWGAATAARAQTPAPSAAPVAAAPFTLEVQAPAPFDVLLQRHLALTRFLPLTDLSPGELERLVAQVPDNVRDLLGTQGHFNPRVTVALNPSPPAPPVVRVQVEPGPATHIATVNLWLQGAARDEAEAAEQRQRLHQDWGLPVGAAFSQPDWDSAKARALRGFSAQRYPRARLETSLADIDPANNAAHLHLVLDSGPAHGFGPVTVRGQRRYDPALAERLVRLAGVHPGRPYDETVLQAAQQRLVDSGYYESAFVVLGEGDDPTLSPVEVRVREARLQKITAGAGVSTDNGARLSLEHIHHRLPGLDWRAVTRLQLERDARSLGAEFSSPPDAQGWRWITGAQLQRQWDDPLLTHSQQWRVGQAQAGPALDRSFFVQYDRSREDSPALGQTGVPESALSAHYTWTRRAFDHPTAPTRGHGLAVELGLGLTLSQDHQPYTRARVRWQAYWPLASGSSRPSRLAWRLEGGGIWSRANTPVPATQRFLAGGDNSVRGYALRDIGVPLASGGVEAGRFLAVTSLEWQRPVWIQGRRSAWETALFIDAGAVANRARDLDPQVGVGAGVRYNSPVGPLQADLAYGLDRRQLRLHLS